MTQEVINIGTIPDDGTGDVLRISFGKVNNNFVEVYSTSANITSNVSNLSTDLLVFEGLIYSEVGVCFDTANAAYTFANNQYAAMNSAYTMANTVNSLFYGAVVNAAAAFNMANSTVVRTNAIYTLTNSAYTVANAAFGAANNVANSIPGVVANVQASFDAANLALVRASDARDTANTGVSLGLQGISIASGAFDFANGVSANTTSAYRVANSAYDVTNVAYGAANAGFFKTNSAFTIANAAFARANTKINTVDGVTTGTFNVQGTHRVDGNVVVYGTSNTFEVRNGQIYINGVLWNPTPVGTIIHSASQAVPVGFLYANGAQVSRTTYSALFSAIGTTFGPGNGSTTFNLPDLRGIFIRGWDNGRGKDPGRAFGSYQDDAFESHTHTDAGHTHNILNTGNNANGGGAGWLVNPQIDTGLQTLTGYADIQATGDTETRPMNLALKPYIKY